MSRDSKDIGMQEVKTSLSENFVSLCGRNLGKSKIKKLTNGQLLRRRAKQVYQFQEAWNSKERASTTKMATAAVDVSRIPRNLA